MIQLGLKEKNTMIQLRSDWKKSALQSGGGGWVGPGFRVTMQKWGVAARGSKTEHRYREGL